MKALVTTRDKRECISALIWPCCVPTWEEKRSLLWPGILTGSQEDHHITMLDFPFSPRVENPSAKAGDTGYDPWAGKTPCHRAPGLVRHNY